ncbi:MAG: site-specific integrase [SAR324 cluster bacterium]|nr:site-specific integrase [SAR324 cluster bacterium]
MERPNLSETLADYATYLREERGLAAATRKSYLTAAREFLSLAAADPQALLLPEGADPTAIDKRALEIYLSHLRDAQGLRPATLATRLGALRAFFSYLQRRGRIARNPARNLRVSSPHREPALPEGEEASVRTLFQGTGSTLAEARLLLLIELIYGAGLKPAAVYGLRGLRPDPAGSGVALSWDEKAQEVPLSPEGVGRAETYLARRREALDDPGEDGADERPFWIGRGGRAQLPAALGRQVHRAMERAGLDGGAKALRLLAARHFKARGADVRSLQRFLGAKRLGSLDRYEPQDFRRVAEAFRRAHPRQR